MAVVWRRMAAAAAAASYRRVLGSLIDKGGANKKGIKFCRRETSVCCRVVKMAKVLMRLQSILLKRSSQAPAPAPNSPTWRRSGRPRALPSRSISSPPVTHSIKRGQQILEIFFPARSKKSIWVSGDFPFRSDGDSWSPSEVRWPSSASLPPPLDIVDTGCEFVSAVRFHVQRFMSYARSIVIKDWARMGSQLRRK